MTQRIFDVENEKDMQDLWDILPEMVKSIEKDETEDSNPYNRYMASDYCLGGCRYIAINWHDKTEIHRPFKEATKSDEGKLCVFWDSASNKKIKGILKFIQSDDGYVDEHDWIFEHCRRLTKQEIKELC